MNQIKEIKSSGNVPNWKVFERVREKFATCQSCQKRGNYYRLWEKYKEWLRQNHPSQCGLFSPCSGTTLENSAPWTNHDLAYDYVESLIIAEKIDISEKGKTSVAAIYIAGMNFLLKSQHQIAEVVLGKHCPSKEVVSVKKLRST